jgi:response regulator of citrate/malate metabolism
VTSPSVVRTLVVDDEQLFCDAHFEYVNRVDGFEAVATARSGGEALRILAAGDIDLVLLDFYLPDMNGLDVCRTMNARRMTADVIAVTSASDLATVRAAISQGAVQYILKPFTFQALRDKLLRYGDYRAAMTAKPHADDQATVDRALAVLRGAPEAALPKGLSQETLSLVIEHLTEVPDPVSASDLGNAAGISRVTARRYLEHLVAQGVAAQTLRYGKTGRPEILYAKAGG